ncbi:hypothetical protein [Paraburkholderia hayleyella]|uniref:hypothetical protein n=1 Tax=Paraburkholderia hayleyella TaxID=2152889 RepID=UPI001292B2E1|nr:hypothetical protein [Paraburkholderia hayleyella]
MNKLKFIKNTDEFNTLLSRAESGIRKITEAPPEQKFLYFDPIDAGTPEYYDFIKNLTKFSNSKEFSFLLTKPDPINIYFKLFGKYPAMKFNNHHDGSDYQKFLDADPGNSPSDAVICIAERYVVLPDADDWIIYADRRVELSTLSGSPEIYEFTRKNYPFNVFFNPDVYDNDFY